MSDVINDIFIKNQYIDMCTYKSLVFDAKLFDIIFISDYQAHVLLLQIISMDFLTHFLILYYNAKYRATNKKYFCDKN